MGQAFRRATGRIGSSRVDTTSHLAKPIERRPPAPPPPPPQGAIPADDVTHGSEGSRVKMDNFLEDRNPEYDAMLGKMVGRIQSKPGGKFEMGEASVVEKYKRPLPKLRNTKAETGRYEERPAPPGTLNIAQIRQIILLHQGKSVNHDGPMDVAQIAEQFRIDAAQVQNILGFVSLPPENDNRKKDNQE